MYEAESQGLALSFSKSSEVPIIESWIIPSDIRIFVPAFAAL